MRYLLVVHLVIVASAARADEVKPPDPIAVPYRLTPTQHVLIRIKLNGKGPFNFILDTGAPALFVVKKVAEKAGVTPDARGWARFDKLEVEGGVVFAPAQGRVEDLFQIEGMNGMGLAGVELHGVIGYNLLARYRIEFDFTRDKLAWTKLDFEPQTLTRMGGKGGSAGLDALGTMMKFLGALMGLKPNFTVEPRGFLGAELVEIDSRLAVKKVLPNGPAANAGLRVGDWIKKVDDDSADSLESFAKRLGKLSGSAKLALTVTREGKDIPITVELGKGL
jgi:membrane-associated protease RseP (regulator of RpoE activity)